MSLMKYKWLIFKEMNGKENYATGSFIVATC